MNDTNTRNANVKNALKAIPNSLNDLLWNVTHSVHFSDLVDNADNLGLVYLGKELAGKNVLVNYISHIWPKPNKPVEVRNSDFNAPYFNIFVGFEEGCTFANELKATKDNNVQYGVSKQILPNLEKGSVYYFVNNCCNGHDRISNVLLEKPSDLWKINSCKDRVDILRKPVSDLLKVPPNLADRLHIIPIDEHLYKQTQG